jgi:hypothetical protein
MRKKNNPFKEIHEDLEPPKELKARIIKDVKMRQLIADSAELFTLKFGKTMGDLSLNKSKNGTNHKNEKL